MRNSAPYPRDCINVMQLLIKFLYNYRNEVRKVWRQNYIPLNCLSKETIFFDSDGHMRVLPLLAHHGHYPIEIPIEVKSHADGDERSDLYSAAYVAVEVFSNSKPGQGLKEPPSPLITECLKSIRDWRPDLNTVYQVLSDSDHLRDVEHIDYNTNDDSEESLRTRISCMFQGLKKWVTELTAPYDVEDAEEDFHMDGTFDKNQVQGFGRGYKFRKGNDDPDGTFH